MISKREYQKKLERKKRNKIIGIQFSAEAVMMTTVTVTVAVAQIMWQNEKQWIKITKHRIPSNAYINRGEQPE